MLTTTVAATTIEKRSHVCVLVLSREQQQQQLLLPACLPADVPPARCLLCFYLFIWLFVCLCLPLSLSACLTVWLFAYAFEQITTTIRIIMAATRMTLSWQIAKQLPQLDSISKFSKCQNICKLLWVLAHSHLRVPPTHMGAPLMETYVYYKFMPAL